MRRWHSGIGKRQVELCPWAYSEIDHLPKEEQLATYSALAKGTGLEWSLQTDSGRKSVHGHISYTRPLRVDDPLRPIMSIAIRAPPPTVVIAELPAVTTWLTSLA